MSFAKAQRLKNKLYLWVHRQLNTLHVDLNILLHAADLVEHIREPLTPFANAKKKRSVHDVQGEAEPVAAECLGESLCYCVRSAVYSVVALGNHMASPISEVSRYVIGRALIRAASEEAERRQEYGSLEPLSEGNGRCLFRGCDSLITPLNMF